MACGCPRYLQHASRGKHAQYWDPRVCNGSCLDSCNEGPELTLPEQWNVGSPEAPLISDLTAEAAVTSDRGWRDSLLHYDPWSTAASFDGGGNLRSALVGEMAPIGL